MAATSDPPDLPPDETAKDATSTNEKPPAKVIKEEKSITHCTKPEVVLASTTTAKTLTISDQHATILLTSPAPKEEEEEEGGEKRGEEIKSLLKLTLVPFHKSFLAFVPKDTVTAIGDDKREDEEKLKEKEEAEKEHSKNVLQFLSQFSFRMTSESGAEYSFHEAFLKSSNEKDDDDEETGDDAPLTKKFKAAVVTNDDTMDQGTATAPPSSSEKKFASFKVELISPASPRQVLRAMPSPGLSLIRETPALYSTITKPFIDKIVESGSLSWLENVVSGQKEKERLLHNGDDWILNIDTKWRTHPDAFKTPREEWFQHESTVDLYCLGIIKTKNIATLRDLRADHIFTLREMLETGPEVIKKIYGVEKDQLKIFVHYQPQFYHFHVHFTRLENDVGSQVEKAHLLEDVIQNLEMDGSYYEKRTMTFKLSLKDRLYKLFAAEAEKDKGGDVGVDMKDGGTKKPEDTSGEVDSAMKDDEKKESAGEEAAATATKTSS